MPINFNASTQRWELLRQFRKLNDERTPGKWRIEDMEFPQGDPDRLFIEFITEHADALIRAMG